MVDQFFSICVILEKELGDGDEMFVSGFDIGNVESIVQVTSSRSGVHVGGVVDHFDKY
jgi:hypothetical protein